MEFNLSRSFALSQDENDDLARYRDEFILRDPDLVYLDGNSLGRMTTASAKKMEDLMGQWSGDLIKGYNQDWWRAPGRVGAKIAHLIGAESDEVIACDTVSTNLFKLAYSALVYNSSRTKIITDKMNFPSDLYILQGLVKMMDNRHALIRIGSPDGDITPDIDELLSTLTHETALLTLSHVTFKSGYLYDMEAITKAAHKVGAIVLWDLSHSVGAVPVELDACDVDMAIGCTYKYLNGGPGSPAFLYINKRLQEQVLSPIWGWWGQKEPFSFGLDYAPATGINRFLSGSQPILSMLTMEAALDPLLDAGIQALRKKSLHLSEYMLVLTKEILLPLGFSIGTPLDPERRGSHISLRHPMGYQINRALIEDLNMIPDFREPDNLRMGLTPLYTSFLDVWEGVDRIRRSVTERLFEKYASMRSIVT